MNTKLILISGILIGAVTGLASQGNVGLNTSTPSESFELSGSGDQYIRLHHTATTNRRAEIELNRGTSGGPGRDWKISKFGDDLRFMFGDNDFESGGVEVMRFKSNGRVGIGTINPDVPLHIVGGENATNTQDGFIVLGDKSAANLVMDNNAMQARSNGNSAALFLQGDGGNMHFGYSGETSTVFNGIGKVSIGGYTANAKLNIDHDLWQLQFNNWGLTQNNWFVGASNESWLVGDDQLIFSPTSSSTNSMFRLMDVVENNGDNAPVMIRSAGGHALLLDGNEIDAKTSALYFNYNSEEDVIINQTGGMVGIGTNDPVSRLHIYSSALTGYHLSLQNGSSVWQISAHGDANVYFWNDGALMAYIDWNGGGTWVSVSDRRFKSNIEPLADASDLIRRAAIRRYKYITASEGREDLGVLAQEIREVVPEAVFEEDGRYGVNYDQLTCVALEGVKEQQKRIDKLSWKVDALLAEYGAK